ncbi:hypothetical protein [Nostocoides australiense]|nr:hypothetical protein [Tetrasphaera australiensis]
MQRTETRTTYTPGATAGEERKGFNPLWLLLPLLAALALWLGWRAMDNDDEPADTTTTSAAATGTEITVPSFDEMTTKLTDAGVANAQSVAQGIENAGPYTADNLVEKITTAVSSAGVDATDVTKTIEALGLPS